MLITEYRVVLPMTVEEYMRAQLYSVAEVSKNETGGGDGIEVKTNEPFDVDAGIHPPDEPLQADKLYKTGQYTHKIYHLQNKVPRFMRLVAPKGSLTVHEKAWNAYPYCRTIITNEYMAKDFYLIIETIHLEDRGDTPNAHNLDQKKLSQRVVKVIDIADTSSLKSGDVKPEDDATKYKSVKTGRGPLQTGWIKTVPEPVMCCYKLVTIHFKWWGLQTKVESYVMKQEYRIFANFNRQLFCWTDNWFDLTMADIRALEDKTKEDLDQQRKTGDVRGTKGEES